MILALPAGWLGLLAVLGYVKALAGAPRAALFGVMALAFSWAALMPQPGWLLAASFGFAWVLICLAAIDLAIFRLPNPLTYPLIASGLAVSLALPGHPLVDHMIGAGLGWGTLAALAWMFRRLRGEDGIGGGDAKLLGAAGAWLGWSPLPSVLLIACAAAFFWIGIMAIARGRAALKARIAFGAPLCLAIWVVWLHGPLAM